MSLTLLKRQLKSTCTQSPLVESKRIFSPCLSPRPRMYPTMDITAVVCAYDNRLEYLHVTEHHTKVILVKEQESIKKLHILPLAFIPELKMTPQYTVGTNNNYCSQGMYYHSLPSERPPPPFHTRIAKKRGGTVVTFFFT